MDRRQIQRGTVYCVGSFKALGYPALVVDSGLWIQDPRSEPELRRAPPGSPSGRKRRPRTWPRIGQCLVETGVLVLRPKDPRGPVEEVVPLLRERAARVCRVQDAQDQTCPAFVREDLLHPDLELSVAIPRDIPLAWDLYMQRFREQQEVIGERRDLARKETERRWELLEQVYALLRTHGVGAGAVKVTHTRIDTYYERRAPDRVSLELSDLFAILSGSPGPGHRSEKRRS